ncbi:hypothetical protein HY643_01905 [Candidatus Woesearchaeota archaeon]|nr:hypothetical protein [Candidatus Woesearchaeota archaeon]
MKIFVLLLTCLIMLTLPVFAVEDLQARIEQHQDLIKKLASDPNSVNISELTQEEQQLIQDLNSDPEALQTFLTNKPELILTEAVFEQALAAKLPEAKTSFNEAVGKFPKFARWILLRKANINIFIGEKTVVGIKMKSMLIEDISIGMVEKPNFELKIPFETIQKMMTEQIKPDELMAKGNISVEAKTFVAKIKLFFLKIIFKIAT